MIKQKTRVLPLRKSKMGQMPFALIAVTILVLAGIYGAISFSIDRNKNNIENMETEISAADAAVKEIEQIVEKGVGEVILDMSKVAVTGTLDERCSTFDERIASWLEFQFPIQASGHVATLSSHDIDLSIGNMRIASAEVLPVDGFKPSCLRADGTINIVMASSSGSSEKTVNVSADGTSTLPILIENATLFDKAITGPKSMLDQLMSYQLSSLTHHRIISGYGAVSEYGPKGTDSILTEEDVKEAYRIAMSIVEATYLRATSDGGDLTSYSTVDAAELLINKNGMAEIDLAAVFSQTIMSIADDLVLRWMDYFMLNKMLDVVDGITDEIKSVVDWFVNALSGDDVGTAGRYLKTTMEKLGISEDKYRHLLTGNTNLTVLSAEYYVQSAAGSENVTLPEMNISVGYPSTDILKWGGWNGFLEKYKSERNEIREMLSGVMKSVAIGVSETYGLGTVRIHLDPYDKTPYASILSTALNDALKSQKAGIESNIENTIRSQKIIDPLFVSMYEQIDTSKNDIFGRDAFVHNIRESVKNSISDELTKSYGGPVDSDIVTTLTDNIMNSDAVHTMINSYDSAIDDRVKFFESVLSTVEKNVNSFFKDILVTIVRSGMDLMGVYPMVEEKMLSLCKEIVAHTSTNPLSGISALSGSTSFELIDGRGDVLKEYAKITSEVRLNVDIRTPQENQSENIHYVEFNDSTGASYSAMYRINVRADVDYQIESSSSLMNLIGTYDSAVTDRSESQFEIAFPVMTGWALAGVRYNASTTFINDLGKMAMEFIEPLMKPLNDLRAICENILSEMLSAIMKATNYVASLINKIYEMIMAPIEKIGDAVDGALGSVAEGLSSIISIGLGAQKFGIQWYDCYFALELNVADLLTNGNNLAKLTLSLPVLGTTMKIVLEIKKLGEKNYGFFGSMDLTADTWNLNITVDPFMKVKKSIAEINGSFDGTDIHIIAPQLVQYDEVEFKLSDIPGVGTALSSVPLPIPGTKLSLDAGVDLKYNVPLTYGLVINEFESNPVGEDAGNEWVELYNGTAASVDINGYVLYPESNPSKSVLIENIVLNPGERTIIWFSGQALNNTRESLVLLDRDGTVADSTPYKSDSKNDESTWQRESDGATGWTLKKNTMENQNGSKILGGNAITAIIQKAFVDAGTKAFKEFGNNIFGQDQMANFVKRLVELAIENVIEVIANSIVSASIFIEVGVSDLTGSGHVGMKLSLIVGGKIVKDMLTWLTDQVKSMIMNIDNPSSMQPAQIISDETYIQMMIMTKITTPKILGPIGNQAGISAGIMAECNITSVSNLFGSDSGRWAAGMGIVFEDVPTRIIPSVLKADSEKKSDLWLIRATFSKAS